MLTVRSSLVLFVAIIAMFIGIMRPHEGVLFCGATILIWLGLQWLLVMLASRTSTSMLDQLQRTIDGESEQNYSLAIGEDYTVQLTGTMNHRISGLMVSVQDVVPAALETVSGYSGLKLHKRSRNQISLVYQIRPQVCGHLLLSGVHITIEDPCGLFKTQKFIPVPQQITVLPFVIRAQTTSSVLKNNNVQRVLGHHRHKTAGLSAELLGIRDYQPGDPPRTIAWKPTARLGKLMSCEFESEVPIRATILADLSSYQFVGRPTSTIADRVITSVASISRLLLSDRDPVALVMYSEFGATRLPHGQGERQLPRIFQRLLQTADPNPRVEYVSTKNLVEIVFRESFRRFPHVFESHTSFVPQHRSLLRPLRGKRHRMICRMAPVLCHVLKLPLGYEYRLIHDPAALRLACVNYLRRFPITTERIQPPAYLYDNDLRSTANDLLCQRLMEAQSRSKDNELLVVIGSLPSEAIELQKVVDVVRLCRARNHRMIYVDAGRYQPHQSVSDESLRQFLPAIEDPLRKRIAEPLIQLGVRCANVDDPKLIEKVAIEVDLIRSGKMRGGRSFAGART